jgi:hypothetical protein
MPIADENLTIEIEDREQYLYNYWNNQVLREFIFICLQCFL